MPNDNKGGPRHGTALGLSTQNFTADSTPDLDIPREPGPAYERYLAAFDRGFAAAWDYLAPKLERANREADHWYFVANNSAAAAAERERLLRDFDVVETRRAIAEHWAELSANNRGGA